MMKWKKTGDFSTVTEVVTAHSGLTEYEIITPLSDPFLWHLEDAVRVIRKCLEQEMPVSIVGDYDCDGMMAASILKLYFSEAEIKSYVRLPRRFSEGYGLSCKIIDEIDEGLVITVDNGIRASDAVKKAKEKGLVVIVTDHHEGSMSEIEADVIVDPHAVEDTSSEFIHYCGAALAYRLGKALFPDSRLHNKTTVLAGIATVADIVPLIGDNRNIVKNSLKMLNSKIVPKGLRILMDAIAKEHYDEVDYGFTLGPIMNASGRLLDDGPDDIVNLVTADKDIRSNPKLRSEMELLVKELIERNETRKELAKRFQEEAEQVICEKGLDKDNFIIAVLPDCPEGIIGIIAGRIAENMRRPCIVFSNSTTEGILKGSGRTAGGVHLKKILDVCAGLLVKYGGHAGAAGLSVTEENVPELRKRVNSILRSQGFKPTEGCINYDLEIQESEIWSVLTAQEMYAPYGEGIRKPVYLIRGYEVIPDTKTGECAKCLGKEKKAIKLTGRRSCCIGFDMADRYVEEGSPSVVDIVGTLSFSYLRGHKTAQVEIIDFKKTNKNMDEKTAALEALFF